MEKQNKPKIHYVHEWLINPTEKVTVNLIGCGGTGSNMLSCLAAINKSLIALGHPGIHAVVFDDDKVTEANAARQLFYECDLGLYKAEALVSRINRSFGTQWAANCVKYDKKYTDQEIDSKANITISCVDTVKARKDIYAALHGKQGYYDHSKSYYWMDTGNDLKSGQVLIGTTTPIEQPASKLYETVRIITSPHEYFKNEKDSKKDPPSCSLAAALSKQDLFINRTIATYAANILWNMFREAKLFYKGIYINLERYLTNPIPL